MKMSKIILFGIIILFGLISTSFGFRLQTNGLFDQTLTRFIEQVQAASAADGVNIDFQFPTTTTTTTTTTTPTTTTTTTTTSLLNSAEFIRLQCRRFCLWDPIINFYQNQCSSYGKNIDSCFFCRFTYRCGGVQNAV